jgi:hypothetical protein
MSELGHLLEAFCVSEVLKQVSWTFARNPGWTASGYPSEPDG